MFLLWRCSFIWRFDRLRHARRHRQDHICYLTVTTALRPFGGSDHTLPWGVDNHSLRRASLKHVRTHLSQGWRRHTQPADSHHHHSPLSQCAWSITNHSTTKTTKGTQPTTRKDNPWDVTTTEWTFHLCHLCQASTSLDLDNTGPLTTWNVLGKNGDSLEWEKAKEI